MLFSLGAAGGGFVRQGTRSWRLRQPTTDRYPIWTRWWSPLPVLKPPATLPPPNITVVSRKQLDNLPAVTVAEALQYIPGVYIEFNGGPGSMAQARIQGSETRLCGGLSRRCAPQPTGQSVNGSLDPGTEYRRKHRNLQRSCIFGLGVVPGGGDQHHHRQAYPRRPLSGKVQISYGEFQTLKSNATLNGGVNDLEYLLAVTHDESDGFVAHAEFQRNSVYAKLGLSAGTTAYLNLVLSYDEGNTADPAP